jgi:hypothetical protein
LGNRPASTEFTPLTVFVGIQLPKNLGRRDNFAIDEHRTERCEQSKPFARSMALSRKLDRCCASLPREGAAGKISDCE